MQLTENVYRALLQMRLSTQIVVFITHRATVLKNKKADTQHNEKR